MGKPGEKERNFGSGESYIHASARTNHSAARNKMMASNRALSKRVGMHAKLEYTEHRTVRLEQDKDMVRSDLSDMPIGLAREIMSAYIDMSHSLDRSPTS